DGKLLSLQPPYRMSNPAMSTLAGLLARKVLLSYMLALPILVGLSFWIRAQGAPENVPGKSAAIDQPQRLSVEPAAIVLNGPRSMQQLVITGHYGAGLVRDLTSTCEFMVKPQNVVSITPEALVLPRQEGTAKLVVKAGKLAVEVPITVRDFSKALPVSFRHQVMAIMAVSGCNGGTCHGSPTGKNGFHLSLRGYEPEADFLRLTREGLGRR